MIMTANINQTSAPRSWPNIPNKNYWSKQSTPGSVVPLAMFLLRILLDISHQNNLKSRRWDVVISQVSLLFFFWQCIFKLETWEGNIYCQIFFSFWMINGADHMHEKDFKWWCFKTVEMTCFFCFQVSKIKPCIQ